MNLRLISSRWALVWGRWVGGLSGWVGGWVGGKETYRLEWARRDLRRVITRLRVPMTYGKWVGWWVVESIREAFVCR